MDPLLTGIAQLGGLGALAAAILMLHRESIKAFRDEMASERARNDANLAIFFNKMDALGSAWQGAQCRYPLHPHTPITMHRRPGEAFDPPSPPNATH